MPWFGACSQTAVFHRLCGGAVHGGGGPQEQDSLQSLKMETPFKMLHGEQSDFSYLRVIGARTFVHIKDSIKFDAAARKGRCTAIARRSTLTESGTQRRGEQERHFRRDTAAPASPTFKGVSVARSSTTIVGYRRRHFGL